MIVRALLLVLTLALAACSPREPTNPLDPDNPDTHGQPRWLFALADSHAVDLNWEVPATYSDVREVRLLSDPADTLWRGPIGAASARASGLPNGVDASFHLELVLASGRVTVLRPEIATPGPAFPWIVDDGAARVRRLTPDGRGVRLSLPSSNPLTLDVDPETGNALVVYFFDGLAELIAPNGETLWLREDLAGPVDVAYQDQGWWIADAGDGRVLRVDNQGVTTFSDTTFTTPISLAAGDSGSVWVADRSGIVGRVGPGRPAMTMPVDTPIAVATAGDGVWVAVRGDASLVRLGPDGTERARADGLTGIVALTPDPLEPLGVWAADRANRIVGLFDANATMIQFIPVSAPSSVAVRPDGSEVWVADSGQSALIRYTRDGEVLARARGATRPTAVAVAWSAGTVAP